MRIHNSMSGRVEEFVPLRPGELRMYNCGPTVYKRQHIGNFRAFSLADLLRRSFEYLGYRVTQIMNITDVGHLSEDDLAEYEPSWVQPLTVDYLGVTVAELPPPTQGVAALEALGLLALGEPTFGDAIECVRLALEDAAQHVRDGADVTPLLDRGRLAARRGQRSVPISEPSGGTSYICTVDGDGMVWVMLGGQ